MEYLLRDIYQRYGIPMIITENGLGARDVLEDGKVHDDYRIDYWTKHLQAIPQSHRTGRRRKRILAMVICRRT